ncbi:uncharacterized protein BCR38DRAFT_485962 [Pseudomassariella vexata]|uniref:Putative transcription factor kapC n=1 Tax=Pseudomassariella vexata TaxID=1141098 RepID=A0A1Y2DVC5_9PEZI|nr:uncharacterized protein BCR38DRAFT_485962 [Pseudomassariella vexata]ORY63198.1 hypothetical protein BCR38DRAFT_485962 [Pseudomassariella vexata]
MPAGISSAPDHSGTGTSAAMAVHGLLDHDNEHDHDHDPDDSTTDGRKAKRELSQSKRAAQNRAAQRAFRQRKEHYIKKLEQQVREYSEMEHSYKLIQNDNYALREYVIQLQSRLLDLQVDPPQAPPHLNLTPVSAASASRSAPAPPNAPEPPPPSTSSAGSLADVAAAVAGLRAREPSADGLYSRSTFKAENTERAPPRTDDEIRRQLQQRDTLPPPSSLRA